MTGFRLILFPVIYILTLVSLFIYESFNDGRLIQSESVTRDSPKHILFFSPDIHVGTTNDLAMTLHSYGHSIFSIRDVLFLGIQLFMIPSFLQKGTCLPE